MADETLARWMDEVCPVLGLDPAQVDVTLLLDLARDVAHGVARPAAPLTTFLVGLAAGVQGAGQDAVEQAAAAASHLAGEFEPGRVSGPGQPA